MNNFRLLCIAKKNCSHVHNDNVNFDHICINAYIQQNANIKCNKIEYNANSLWLYGKNFTRDNNLGVKLSDTQNNRHIKKINYSYAKIQ